MNGLELLALTITFIAGGYLLADLAGRDRHPPETSIDLDLDGRQRRWAHRHDERDT